MHMLFILLLLLYSSGVLDDSQSHSKEKCFKRFLKKELAVDSKLFEGRLFQMLDAK